MSPTPRTQGAAATAVGILLSAVFGVPFLLFGWMALSSRLGWSGGDPHGYALIVGTLLALVAGIATALAVPLLFPRRTRAKAYLGSLVGYLIVAAGLVVALLTA